MVLSIHARTTDHSYQSFANAINRISAFELLIERRCGTNLQRITHINKVTGAETLISISEFSTPLGIKFSHT